MCELPWGKAGISEDQCVTFLAALDAAGYAIVQKGTYARKGRKSSNPKLSEIKTCLQCGGKFLGKLPRKYCSPKCSNLGMAWRRGKVQIEAAREFKAKFMMGETLGSIARGAGVGQSSVITALKRLHRKHWFLIRCFRAESLSEQVRRMIAIADSGEDPMKARRRLWAERDAR